MPEAAAPSEKATATKAAMAARGGAASADTSSTTPSPSSRPASAADNSSPANAPLAIAAANNSIGRGTGGGYRAARVPAFPRSQFVDRHSGAPTAVYFYAVRTGLLRRLTNKGAPRNDEGLASKCDDRLDVE